LLALLLALNPPLNPRKKTAAYLEIAENVDTAALQKLLAEISKQRWAEVDGAERTMAIGRVL
jgi:hypothetical protein